MSASARTAKWTTPGAATPARRSSPSARAMLRLARWITALRRPPGVSWLEGRAEKLPLPDDQATVVWAIGSAHHWEDRGAGIGEAWRVPAPGGRLVLAERLARPGARGHAAHGLTRDHAEDLARQLADAGFGQVRLHTAGQATGPWSSSAGRKTAKPEPGEAGQRQVGLAGQRGMPRPRSAQQGCTAGAGDPLERGAWRRPGDTARAPRHRCLWPPAAVPSGRDDGPSRPLRCGSLRVPGTVLLVLNIRPASSWPYRGHPAPVAAKFPWVTCHPLAPRPAAGRCFEVTARCAISCWLPSRAAPVTGRQAHPNSGWRYLPTRRPTTANELTSLKGCRARCRGAAARCARGRHAR